MVILQCVKNPPHLPILLALCLTLLVDANDGPPDSLLTHLRPLITPKPSPPPPLPIPKTVPKQDLIVQFSKKIYKDLGHNRGNITAVVDKYQGEFDNLDGRTGGSLGETLSALLEIRMLDLQASVRHARRMHNLIDKFAGKSPQSDSI